MIRILHLLTDLAEICYGGLILVANFKSEAIIWIREGITLKLAVLCNFHSTSAEHPLTIELPWQPIKSQMNKTCIFKCSIGNKSLSFIFLLQIVLT